MQRVEENIRKDVCRLNSKFASTTNIQINSSYTNGAPSTQDKWFELSLSSVLMQNEGIWNFHGSLTLNKGKLI